MTRSITLTALALCLTASILAGCGDDDAAANRTASDDPTEAATQAPSEAPTEVATEAPTEVATEAPTEAPAEAPSEAVEGLPDELPGGFARDTVFNDPTNPQSAQGAQLMATLPECEATLAVNAPPVDQLADFQGYARGGTEDRVEIGVSLYSFTDPATPGRMLALLRDDLDAVGGCFDATFQAFVPDLHGEGAAGQELPGLGIEDAYRYDVRLLSETLSLDEAVTDIYLAQGPSVLHLSITGPTAAALTADEILAITETLATSLR